MRQALNLGPAASLREIAQASCPTLSLFFPICKWAQEPLASRAAVRAQCLAQEKHSAGVHTLSPFLVSGARPCPTPYPEPRALPSAPLICYRKATLPLTEILRLIPDPGRLRGVTGCPRVQRPSSPGGEYEWRELEVLAQGGFPPVGGSRMQRVDAWAATPRGELKSQGLVGPPPGTLPPRATGSWLLNKPRAHCWVEGAAQIRKSLWPAGPGTGGLTRELGDL